MNVIQFIKNRIELKTVRKELKKLNSKYFSCVDCEWRKKNYSENVICFPVEVSNTKQSTRVSFLRGIDLVLANKRSEKRVFLSKMPSDVKMLVKHYVSIKGFSDTFVESQEDLVLS